MTKNLAKTFLICNLSRKRRNSPGANPPYIILINRALGSWAAALRRDTSHTLPCADADWKGAGSLCGTRCKLHKRMKLVNKAWANKAGSNSWEAAPLMLLCPSLWIWLAVKCTSTHLKQSCQTGNVFTSNFCCQIKQHWANDSEGCNFFPTRCLHETHRRAKAFIQSQFLASELSLIWRAFWTLNAFS